MLSVLRTACTLSLTAFAIVTAAPAAAAGSDRASDKLKPIADCVQAGGLRTLELTRLPESSTARPVEVHRGKKPLVVTTADGYRLLLATPNGQPFVNLKLESSPAGDFAQNRRAIEAQMRALSDRRLPQAEPLAVSRAGDVEIFALHQPELTAPGPLSFYTFFNERSDTIATAYVLNQHPSSRAFRSMAEFNEQQRVFVEALIACLSKPARPAQ